MIEGSYDTISDNYEMDNSSYQKYGVDENIPYFNINGHNFHISTKAESKSDINLVKNKMFVAGKNWGYTDIQWTNFTGATISGEIYSRVTDRYKGEEAQPSNGGISDFYKVPKTPHAVLKYWAEMFVVCHIDTNLHAFESGNYVIEEFTQSNPTADFVVTKLTFVQYERPGEIEQTYHTNLLSSTKSTALINAQAEAISKISNHGQQCSCNEDTPYTECTASENGEVTILQKNLQQWGYFPTYISSIGKIEANGKYCYHTTQAIKEFQRDRGITETGSFDEETKKEFIKVLGGI